MGRRPGWLQSNADQGTAARYGISYLVQSATPPPVPFAHAAFCFEFDLKQHYWRLLRLRDPSSRSLDAMLNCLTSRHVTGTGHIQVNP
jgi:hypothetical protein